MSQAENRKKSFKTDRIKYATYKQPKLDPHIVTLVERRMFIQVGFFLVTLGASYLNTGLSIVLFLLVQLSYVFLTTQTPTGAPAEVENTVSQKQIFLLTRTQGGQTGPIIH
ncbi:hypothetical protein GCM10028818_61620 [Spirosoma horti]